MKCSACQTEIDDANGHCACSRPAGSGYAGHAGSLLPCPFCGRIPFSGQVSSDVPGMEDCGYYAVECRAGDHFAGVHGDEQTACEGLWNRRANNNSPST